MSVSAGIIDQRVQKLAEDLKQRIEAELGIRGDSHKHRSVAFVFFCLQSLLDIDEDEAFDCLVEGSQDFGVDAFHIGGEHDGEFAITLFQGKYSKKLDGSSGFPAVGLEKVVQAARVLFDPSIQLQSINERLRARVEEARSMIRDGLIPQVRVIACNNGRRWESNGEEVLRLAQPYLGDRVTWEHCNHERLVKLQQATRPIQARLQMTGEALVEDMNFSRVLIGRMTVEEVAKLIEEHGERLLERNVRRYLGLHGNRVNEGIQHTLTSNESSNFYFYNNGITLTCDKFSYNALQKSDFSVRVDGLQIINGGQTCMTIHQTLQAAQLNLYQESAPASVLVRLYQLPSDNEDLVRRITYATNSQNPVDLRDLRANDERQKQIELELHQQGYFYRRKRSGTQFSGQDISTGAAAQAVLAIWRQRPHQAKFYSREHFGKLYDLIFDSNLNGTQVIIAVLIYRLAEQRRRRPRESDPEFIRYASAFIAMQMGRRLMYRIGSPPQLTHDKLTQAREILQQDGDDIFQRATGDIKMALTQLYGERSPSLQQLAATFRRGDLIQSVLDIPLD